MNIFYKRPLSLILCITLGSFVFFTFYERFLVRIISLFVALSVLILTFIKPIKKLVSPILPRAVSICALTAMLFSFVYFDLWFNAYERYDGDVKIVGIIEDMERSSHRSSILIRTSDIDQTPLSRYKLIVYLENEEYYGYSIGSTVELSGEISSFSSVDNFDAVSYYNSRGISGVVKEVNHFSVTDVGEYPTSYKIKDFRESICRRIKINSNEDVGGLLCALLLGEKDYLPLGTKLDFSRIGISHILALSGMHLAILSIGLTKFLLFLGLGKKPATLITALFTAVYMVLTGLPLSVMRAGFMLVLSSLLFLLARSKDSMTSLFVSLTAICIIQPYAIFDTSLWLSAFATLGIVVMSEYQSEKYSKPSFLRWIATSFLASFFAISATFFITAVKFDGTSLLAPISTLVFSLLVESFVYIGLILLAVGDFILVKYPFILLGNVNIKLAGFLSDFDWVYISTNFAVIEILAVIFSLLLFAFFILKVKRKRLVIMLLFGMLCSIFCLSAILTYAKQYDTSITYCNESEEHLLLTENGKSLVIDISSYSKNSAYALYSDVSENSITKIDKYVLTHYSYYLPEAVTTAVNNLLIREIYLPVPQSATEERIFSQISDISEKADFELHMYLNEEAIAIGEAKIIPLHNYRIGEQKKNMFTILYKDKIYTYLTDDMLEGETKSMATEVIAGSHAIILGRHKSDGTICEFSQKFDNLEKIIFSTTRIGIDTEIYKYYLDNGADLFINPKKTCLYVE